MRRSRSRHRLCEARRLRQRLHRRRASCPIPVSSISARSSPGRAPTSTSILEGRSARRQRRRDHRAGPARRWLRRGRDARRGWARRRRPGRRSVSSDARPRLAVGSGGAGNAGLGEAAASAAAPLPADCWATKRGPAAVSGRTAGIRMVESTRVVVVSSSLSLNEKCRAMGEACFTNPSRLCSFTDRRRRAASGLFRVLPVRFLASGEPGGAEASAQGS